MGHGHWIYEFLDSFRKFRNTCSNCKWSSIDNYDGYVEIDSFNYCPNCGAKMDEEEK